MGIKFILSSPVEPLDNTLAHQIDIAAANLTSACVWENKTKKNVKNQITALALLDPPFISKNRDSISHESACSFESRFNFAATVI